MRRQLAWSCLMLLGLSTSARAQQPIVAASRGVDWHSPGVPGGIPNRTTICATLSPGATAAQINSAIAACPANQVVFLRAGTYNLSAGIGFAGKNNVTLRGSGPDVTILKFSGGNGCSAGNISAYSGLICAGGSSGVFGGDVGTVTNIHNWTANYAQGTTQLVLDSTSGLVAGTVIVMDQCDETTDDGGITNSAYGSTFMNESMTLGPHETTGC